MYFNLNHIFSYLKNEVHLILVTCVKSFEMAIVKITRFIHNAFGFTASLPVNNFHCWIAEKYISQHLVIVNKDRNIAHSWMLHCLLPTHTKHNSA